MAMLWALILTVLAAGVQSQLYNIAVSQSKRGTSSTSSGHASSVAQGPYGSSIVSSEFGGSSTGTSGKGTAYGSNPFGKASSESIKGTAVGTTGHGASSAEDIYGHMGSASSKGDGAASNTAGGATSRAVNNLESYMRNMYGQLPVFYPGGGPGRISENDLFTFARHGGNYLQEGPFATGIGSGHEMGLRSGFEPLDMKVRRIVGDAVPIAYAAVPSPFMFEPNIYVKTTSRGGTATASSEHGSASSVDRYGGSDSRSQYGGSASGTSGYGKATGINQFGVSISGSTDGIATGSSGDASSGSHDIYGHRGTSVSQFGGAASETAGTGKSQAGNYGQYYRGVEGYYPNRGPFEDVRYNTGPFRDVIYTTGPFGDVRYFGGSHSVAMDGGTASGTSHTGGSSAAAPGVFSSAGVGSAGSAAGKRGASASAGGVSAAAARKSHKKMHNELPILLGEFYPGDVYYPIRHYPILL
ncbi:hypothetical protein C0J52_23687 [Blattella germanica]|nr:hypothetical protein C0J52_23687 [Blattella germanica]